MLTCQHEKQYTKHSMDILRMHPTNRLIFLKKIGTMVRFFVLQISFINI